MVPPQRSTRQTLVDNLMRLGVRPDDLLMVHAGLRAVGPIVGGANVLVQALLDAVGSEGTLTAYVDFEPFFDEEDDPSETPVFDKRIASAARDHGVLHEILRNWPAAVRSDHPDAGVVAVGRLAEWVTTPHPFQYGYGEGTPFERIVEANGRVLMIGAPLDTITMLHYADHLAQIPGKRVVRYRRLMPGPTGATWVDFEEYDTSEPVCDRLPEDYFSQIAESYMAAGFGREGLIGHARSYLLDTPELVQHAVDWLERFSRAEQARNFLP
jgi:aminoglycoside 3-N-acetyltransferase